MDLLVLTSSDHLLLVIKILFTCFEKQATLMRRSTALSLSLPTVSIPCTHIPPVIMPPLLALATLRKYQ